MRWKKKSLYCLSGGGYLETLFAPISSQGVVSICISIVFSFFPIVNEYIFLI